MCKEIVIIGASGHGKVIADIVQKSGEKVIGFLDDNYKLKDTFIGLPFLGVISRYKEYVNQAEFVIAIGNAVIRERIAKQLSDVEWYTAIHPTAIVSNVDVTIGHGTVIMANAVINSGSYIGHHCIINTSSVVEHDNVIEDFVHISVGARLAGNVHVGRATWIGIGASVSNNIEICKECMIGAGAVVVKNIENSGTYVGNPVKKLIDNN